MPKCSQIKICDMKNLEVKIFIPSNPKDRWYIYVYDNVQKKIIHKTYKGINTEPDLIRRQIICESFKKSLENELKSGWVPKQTRESISPLPQPYQFDMTILEAYKKAIDFN